jgi:hypothetical protein
MTRISGYVDGFNGVSPVGSLTADDCDVYDLVGNVAELCRGRGDGHAWVGGAAWNSVGFAQEWLPDSMHNLGSGVSDAIGFRCVWDAK